MSGYDNPITATYDLDSVAFAASPAATAIKGPKGMQGRIRDIGVRATVLFTNVTTGAQITVGTTGDADAYALLNIGAAAATDVWNTVDDTDAISATLLKGYIPADTQIEVAYVAPTGGTPAGTGFPFVVIDWF